MAITTYNTTRLNILRTRTLGLGFYYDRHELVGDIVS